MKTRRVVKARREGTPTSSAFLMKRGTVALWLRLSGVNLDNLWNPTPRTSAAFVKDKRSFHADYSFRRVYAGFYG
jgi:hypothetical protein